MADQDRIEKLERRVDAVEEMQTTDSRRVDGVLQAVVDVHEDLRALRAEVAEFRAEVLGLRNDLPDIIAKAIAPLLVARQQ